MQIWAFAGIFWKIFGSECYDLCRDFIKYFNGIENGAGVKFMFCAKQFGHPEKKYEKKKFNSIYIQINSTWKKAKHWLVWVACVTICTHWYSPAFQIIIISFGYFIAFSIATHFNWILNGFGIEIVLKSVFCMRQVCLRVVRCCACTV